MEEALSLKKKKDKVRSKMKDEPVENTAFILIN